VKGKVLIVEDEVLISWSLKILLAREGYTVLGPVTSGPEALDAAGDGPDVVLMDVQLMGPMDGIETARRLREVTAAHIIFTTGYSDNRVRSLALALGPAAILYKPIVPSVLLDEIDSCLADQRKNR